MRNNDLEDTDFEQRESENSVTLSDILIIVRQNLKWFILSIIVCLCLGYLYIKSSPKIFSRTATVLVKDDKKSGSMGEAAAFQDLFSLGSNSIDNELGIFKSKRLMNEVAQQLDLNISYRHRSGLRNTELYRSTPFIVMELDTATSGQQSYSFTAKLLDHKQVELIDFVKDKNEYDKSIVANFNDTIITPIGKIILIPTKHIAEDFDGEKIHVTKSNLSSTANGFNRELQVDVINKGSSLIKLTILDESVERAENVLNTLIEVYKTDAIDDKNRIVINTAKFINERLQLIEGELGSVDAEIENFKKTNRLTDITSETSLYLQSTGKLESEGLSVVNLLNVAEYLKSYLMDNSKAENLLPIGVGINDVGIQNQISEYNTILLKRDKLMSNSSANNPIVKEMNNALLSLRSAILKATDNHIAALKIQTKNMMRKEKENMSKIAYIPSQQKYVMSIERQQKIKEELYLYLLNKKEENSLQLSINESNCRIIDPANGDNTPVEPKSMVIMLLSLIIGCSIPAIILYLKSLLNTSVWTKQEIVTAVNVPFLGDIPLTEVKQTNNIVVDENSRDIVSEAFNILRDNLYFMDNHAKSVGTVIQVTSFNPGSGKTFIATNIATSLALINNKTIILDLDLRIGTLSKNSGYGTRQSGISNYISGKITDIKTIIHPYINGSNLDIITSGSLPPNPAVLLKNGKLDELIAQLKMMYDCVILDTPPYGMVVDSAICNRLVDNTIFVIRSGLFDKRLFPELQKLYNTNTMVNMSIVLNGVDYKKTRYGYGYGYGRGYGYGYGYGNGSGDKHKQKFWKRSIRLLRKQLRGK